MVIEAFHAGRQVPCPWCRASNEVPRQIDFGALARSQVTDESRGAWMLVCAVAACVVPCILVPLAAWVWWVAHGNLARAADEGRPGDAMVKTAMWLSILACIGWGGGLSLVLLLRFR
jgi:hypothetical protein